MLVIITLCHLLAYTAWPNNHNQYKHLMAMSHLLLILTFVILKIMGKSFGNGKSGNSNPFPGGH